MRKGAEMNIAECFKMEYRLVKQFFETPDFVEGVYAKLIDKREPKWSPTLKESVSLSNEMIDAMFFNKKKDDVPLELDNNLTFNDYPHRTLSGLPTDRDIKRVLAGEADLSKVCEQPRNRQQVFDWIQRNWGNIDKKVMGVEGKITPRASISGNTVTGKVGLVEKVAAILDNNTRLTANGIKWINN